MTLIYAVHIIAGTLGLLTGYVALATTKGGSVHRRVGMLFVYSMLTMAVFGATITAARGIAPSINFPAALITAALIITSLLTVKPLGPGYRWLDHTATLVAFAVGVTTITWGVEAAVAGTKYGMPAFPYFLFGIVGMLAAIGDIRVMLSGPLTGARRLARHLWRMSFALFFAALSASVQFAKMAPKPFRVPIMAIPMLVVVGAMLYWMWRVRVRKSLLGFVVKVPVTALEAS